jgi:hypothetical protein
MAYNEQAYSPSLPDFNPGRDIIASDVRIGKVMASLYGLESKYKNNSAKLAEAQAIKEWLHAYQAKGVTTPEAIENINKRLAKLGVNREELL